MSIAPDPAAGAADIVIRGGPIHTLDAGARVVDALAIRDGWIVAAGRSAEVERFAGSATEVVELDGRAVLPGINDGHLHGVWLGALWPRLFFEGGSEDAHRRLLSTAGERRAALLKAWSILASFGITSYTEPGIGPGEDDGETGCFGTNVLQTYLELAGTREQTARVTLLSLFGLLDGPTRFADVERGLPAARPAGVARWLTLRGMKIFADGIPPLGTAWVGTPYRNGGFGGLMTGEGDEAARLADFTAMVELAHARGLQVAVHATGDRTIEEFVGIVERLGGAGALGHYVIHGDLVRPAQLERMRRAGMGLAVQPLIAEHAAGWLADAVTPEVAAGAWPFHLMLDPELRVTLGSDAPIASPDWRRTIAAAARLLAASGVTVGRGQLTRLLGMYTSGAAEQDGAADWKGTLEVGKVADLCILAADPYEAGAAGLPEVTVERTIVEGRTVYRRADARDYG